MAFAGDFPTPSAPGARQSFSMDFTAALAANGGGVVASANATLAPFLGADTNATNLLIGSPSISSSGAVVSQWIGSNGSNGALVPGVIYRWTLTVTTSEGATLVYWAHIHVAPIA